MQKNVVMIVRKGRLQQHLRTDFEQKGRKYEK